MELIRHWNRRLPVCATILLAAAAALPGTPTNLYFVFMILVFLVCRQPLGIIEGIKTDRLLLLHFLYLSLVVVTATREENVGAFIKVMEKQFMLILPFFFFKLELTENDYRNTIRFFIISVVYASIVNLILVVDRLPEIDTFYKFSWHLGKVSWFASNYLSLFGSLAVLFLFHSFFEKRLFSWFWSIAIFIFLLCFLAVLGSRTSFFSMVLLMFGLLAVKAMTNRKLVIALIIFLISAPILIATIPYFRFRVVVLFTHGFVADPRYFIYQAVENVLQTKPWLGLGFTGRDEALLHQYTDVSEYLEGISENYNAHNQFFDTAMVCGLPGVVLLFGIYGYSLYRGFKRRNFIAVAFTLMIILNSLTESLLERNKGILLFSFFTGLLLINRTKNSPAKDLNTHSESKS